MAEQYIRKYETITAMQLTEDNLDEVMYWLKANNIEYSFDPIKSGGVLIVYTNHDGPVVALPNWWIIIESQGRVAVYSDVKFNHLYESRGE